jgi:cell division inhibitor SepF
MPGLLRKTMVYLGLVDDDLEEYEHYDEPQPVAPQRGAGRAYASEPEQAGMSSIRTIPREAPEYGGMAGVTVQPRSAVVRPIQPVQNAKPHVVQPGSFADAQEIGDRLKASQPVIVNLQGADRELSRRMIDFCSGATYVLGGSMDKVADQVFLLTPSNVEVSAEEKRRLHERNYRT